jgi:hypothetical protein
VEDEWFIFYVLFTLTQKFSELTVKVRQTIFIYGLVIMLVSSVILWEKYSGDRASSGGKACNPFSQVTDTDGQFLLIEAANALPAWVDPETAEHRVRLPPLRSFRAWIIEGGRRTSSRFTR